MKEKKPGKGLKKTPFEPQVDLPPTHADFSFDDTPKRFKLLMKKIRHTPDGKTPRMIGQDNVQNTTRLSLEKQNRNQKNHFASSGEMELPKSHGTGTAPTSKSRSSLVKSNGRKNTVLKVSKESGLQKPKSSRKRKNYRIGGKNSLWRGSPGRRPC